VRGRIFGLLIGAAAILPPAAVAADPCGALAARVLIMARGGQVRPRNDPFLQAPAVTPAPATIARSGPLAPATAARSRRAAPATVAPAIVAPSRRQAAATIARSTRRSAPPPKKPSPTVTSELARLYRTQQIDLADYRSYSASLSAALSTEKRLRGTRAVELEAVIENLHDIAAAGELTPSRLPALFLTLDDNRQWWTTGPIPFPGQLIEFTGSQLVWEYYPGQGIELQVLATFGRADGMYTAGSTQYPQLRELLSEMIPLAAQRGGGLTWEYYFHFDGGSPPWTSAMSQGTAVEALTRAALAFGQGSETAGGPDPPSPAPGSQPATGYLQLAHRALPIFTVAPPTGVSISAPAGARYVQYSFQPGTDILNAFLQSLIGLYDYARVSGDPVAQRLFAAGNAEAEAEVPRFDTGAWSLYQPGVEDSLSYHELVTGFLQQLCSRTSAPVYCTTAQHFQTYLTTPPALALLTSSATAKRAFTVRFHLSKYSHVGIVIARGQSTVFLTSASFGYGVDSFAVPSLPAGNYTVRLAATDLAGNFNRITGALQVLPGKK